MGPFQYSYRIIDNAKGEVLSHGHGRAENLGKLFPGGVHGFLKKEIERGRLTDTRIKMADRTYGIRPTERQRNLAGSADSDPK